MLLLSLIYENVFLSIVYRSRAAGHLNLSHGDEQSSHLPTDGLTDRPTDLLIYILELLHYIICINFYTKT